VRDEDSLQLLLLPLPVRLPQALLAIDEHTPALAAHGLIFEAADGVLEVLFGVGEVSVIKAARL
jgi:hypothetical protein